MTVSIPDFPGLQDNKYILLYSVSQPSYFIDDKGLIVCTCDEIGQACIYIVRREDSVSSGQREDQELAVQFHYILISCLIF